jgi:hypothetical protein
MAYCYPVYLLVASQTRANPPLSKIFKFKIEVSILPITCPKAQFSHNYQEIYLHIIIFRSPSSPISTFPLFNCFPFIMYLIMISHFFIPIHPSFPKLDFSRSEHYQFDAINLFYFNIKSFLISIFN